MAQPNLIERFRAALRTFRFTIGGNVYESGSGWMTNQLPGSNYDYRKEAGVLTDNSIIHSCLLWMQRTYPEAPPCVEWVNKNGDWAIVPGHEALYLLGDPNPYYDASVLMSGILLSYFVDGNAYIYKVRSQAGKVVGLLYVPHFSVEPAWAADGSNFISHYQYKVNGVVTIIAVEDIVHIRNGMDPSNTRKGMSPLGSVLREVCTDNEAATYAAALLRNSGVPGVVISPETADGEFNPDTRERLQTMWRERFGGDRRGEPFVFSHPIKIAAPAFSPANLLLDKVRQIPEERICAVLGIPAIVAGMGAGLARSTFSNYKESREAAYESNVIPTLRAVASQLTRQLLPDLGGKPGERISHDLSNVRALQDDQNELAKRLVALFAAGIMKRSEARSEIGLLYTPEDEIYFTDIVAAQQEASANTEHVAERDLTNA